MDLDEWEILPSDGFIDLQKDGENSNIDPKIVIDMNYFQNFTDPHDKKMNKVHYDHKFGEILLDEKEIPEDEGFKEQIKDPKQETVSQVSFKKLKENEFVDIKMDSPKSQNRGILAQNDVGNFEIDEKDGSFDEKTSIKDEKDSNLKEGDDDDDGVVKLWKWAMTGVGAVFSFGFAAATLSIIVLGNRHRDQNHHKSSELHFQINTCDKRIKQVVHHAKKLNDAFTAARGTPLSRAHFTTGGYCEGI